jgi:hypothetical protein
MRMFDTKSTRQARDRFAGVGVALGTLDDSLMEFFAC